MLLCIDNDITAYVRKGNNIIIVKVISYRVCTKVKLIIIILSMHALMDEEQYHTQLQHVLTEHSR